jgi:hypothetical protein
MESTLKESNYYPCSYLEGLKKIYEKYLSQLLFSRPRFEQSTL